MQKDKQKDNSDYSITLDSDEKIIISLEELIEMEKMVTAAEGLISCCTCSLE